MKYEIIGKNVKITEAMDSAIRKKMQRIERYFENQEDIKCLAVVSTEKEIQKIEITVFNKELPLRAEIVHKDMYAALDLAIDKLEGQIRKLKTRSAKRGRKIGLSENINQMLESTEEEDIQFEIKRKKKIELAPMDEEEAITRMDALNHSFYIFINSNNGKVTIAYVRKNEGYGLIEVED